MDSDTDVIALFSNAESPTISILLGKVSELMTLFLNASFPILIKSLVGNVIADNFYRYSICRYNKTTNKIFGKDFFFKN